MIEGRYFAARHSPTHGETECGESELRILRLRPLRGLPFDFAQGRLLRMTQPLLLRALTFASRAGAASKRGIEGPSFAAIL